MKDTEIFDFLKKEIQKLDEDNRRKMENSLINALTLESKKFRIRAQEIHQRIQELMNEI